MQVGHSVLVKRRVAWFIARVQFSIITPSYGQLDWLRLCVASVRDQSYGGNAEQVMASESAAGRPLPSPLPLVSPSGLPAASSEISRSAVVSIPASQHPSISACQHFRRKLQHLSISVEHLIQDAVTPGIEEFAREIGANFYRDGELVFSPHNQEQETSNYALSIYSESDNGMYDAINRGFERAVGDVCAWLNCDEQYLPGTLAKVAAFFRDNPEADMVFGDAIILDEHCTPYSYRRVVLPSMDYLRTVMPNLFSCSGFFRRRVIDSGIRFDPQWRIIGDAVWFYRLFEVGFTAATLKEPLAAFALTGSNLSTMAESSALEWDKWRASQPSSPTLPRPALIGLHRLKKMLGGAYRKRVKDIEVYAQSNPGVRRQFERCSLGTSWLKTR